MNTVVSNRLPATYPRCRTRLAAVHEFEYPTWVLEVLTLWRKYPHYFVTLGGGDDNNDIDVTMFKTMPVIEKFVENPVSRQPPDPPRAHDIATPAPHINPRCPR